MSYYFITQTTSRRLSLSALFHLKCMLESCTAPISLPSFASRCGSIHIGADLQTEDDHSDNDEIKRHIFDSDKSKVIAHRYEQYLDAFDNVITAATGRPPGNGPNVN